MKIRSLITIFILFFLTVFIFVILDKVLPNLSQRSVNLLPVVYGHVGGERMMPTHFFVNKGHNKQIISDFANSRFLYREIKQPNTWIVSNMPSLNRPHALTYSPEAKKYFAVDTDNHQLISFSSFDVEVMNDIERFCQCTGIML